MAGPMRYSVAVPIAWNGAGLGNEVRVLAKAYLGAQVLGAELVEQPWGLNRFRYGGEMGHNLVLPAAAFVSRAWTPTVTIGKPDFVAGQDYVQLLSDLAPSLPERFVLRHASGMKGGLWGIRQARQFLRDRLGFQDQARPPGSPVRIGLHVRRGDFSPGVVRPGTFNTRLGLEWTTAAAVAVAEGVPGDREFVLFTDARPDEVDGLVRQLGGTAPVALAGGSVLEDLAGLAACDWLVPAISSYSMLAVFLGESRYVWPHEHLFFDRGLGSVWANEPDVAAGPTATAQAAALEGVPSHWFRAVPFSPAAARPVSEWVSKVSEHGGRWDDLGDLVLYGVAPDLASGSTFTPED